MGFTVNHKEAAGGGIIPAGEYEVIIKDAFAGKTAGGASCINLRLTIRNDCGQELADRTIYDSLYKRREPEQADLAVDGYSAKQIQSLSKAAGLPDGKNYSGLEEWMEDLTGRLLRVTVEHENYNGKEKDRVKWRNETQRPNCTHVWKGNNPAAGKTGFTDVTAGGIADDDIPF